MQASQAIYLLKKLHKQLQIDGCDETSAAVLMAADALEKNHTDNNANASHKRKNMPTIGRGGGHVTGVVGMLRGKAINTEYAANA